MITNKCVKGLQSGILAMVGGLAALHVPVACGDGLPSIGGLQLWLKADAGVTTNAAGQVSAWADQSGNGNDVAAPSTQPVWSGTGFNGHPGISFANGGYLENTTANLVDAGSPRTVIVAGQGGGSGLFLFSIRRSAPTYTLAFYLSAPPHNYTWTDNNGANNWINGATVPQANTPFYAAFVSPGAGQHLQVYLNGVYWPIIGGSTITAEGGAAGFIVSDASGNHWDGTIAEVLVYDSALSDADRESVEAYLRGKYLPPPPLADGLKLWLDAGLGVTTNAGGEVSAWADQSGHGNCATAPSTKPVWSGNALGGKPAISFTGSGGLANYISNLVTAGAPRTVFAVGKANAGGNGGGLIQIRRAVPGGGIHVYINELIAYDNDNLLVLYAGDNARIGTNAFALLTSPFCATFASPGAGSQPQVYINGGTRGVTWWTGGSSIGNDNDATADGFLIGGRADGWDWNGDIAELLVYDGLLSAADRATVEMYLRNKYSLPDAALPLPPVTAGLKLWLDAAAGAELSGGSVWCWADQSGNGNHVAGSGPLWSGNGLNGHAAISFANRTFLANYTSSLVTGGAARTVFAVGQAGNAGRFFLRIRITQPWYVNAFFFSGNNFTWTDGSVNNYISGSTIPLVQNPFYASFVSPGAGSQLQVHINGKNWPVSGSVITAESGGTGFVISDDIQPWDGTLSAILVYDSALAEADRAEMEYYLGVKYGFRPPRRAGTIISLR
ncbi:MAG: hypothetical protein PHR35_05380 [Kiritimatiellae bacterium]|nr:hypothetical protein [Kiritimatiellia bacterium]